MNRLAYLGCLALTAGLCACETTGSSDLKTSGIDIEALASASSATKTTVTATLMPGGDDDPFNKVKLQNGDTLYCEADGEKHKMSEKSTGTYETTFAIADEDTLFTISLERDSDEDKDAPDSNVTLPAPFEIDDLEKDTYSRAEDLTVTWAPDASTDSMSIEVDGDCILGSSARFNVDPDEGTFTIGANEIEPFDSKKEESCSATLTIKRMRSGSADPALNEESSFNAEQVRKVTFTSDP
jgi:hypothetical protein